MSAQAKLIRNHIKDELRAAGTAAGARVFAARHRPLQQTDLPAILVFTDSERTIETHSLGNGFRRYVRELEVHVSLVLDAGGADDHGELAADSNDDLAEEVETWWFAREENDPIWVEALLARVEGGVATESARPVDGQVLVFDVTYHDYAPKQGSGVPDDLNLIHAEQDVDSDPTSDVADDITVLQS